MNQALREWLTAQIEQGASTVTFAASDESITGTAVIAALLNEEALLPEMDLALRNGRKRFLYEPAGAPPTVSASHSSDGAAVKALQQALANSLQIIRELSAHVNAQVRSAVEFQAAAASGQLELFGLHNHFVAEHANFVLSTSRDVGMVAAQVASQSRPDSRWTDAANALATAFGPLLARGMQLKPSADDSSDREFSIAEIGELHNACPASAVRAFLSRQTAPLSFEAMREALTPHQAWIAVNVMTIASKVSDALRVKLQRFVTED